MEFARAIMLAREWDVLPCPVTLRAMAQPHSAKSDSDSGKIYRPIDGSRDLRYG